MMKRLTYTELNKLEKGSSCTYRITDPRALSNAARIAYKWGEVNGFKVSTSVDRKKKTITVTRL